MSAKEYETYVVNRYKELSDSIAADSLPPLMKEQMLLSLKDEAVMAMMNGDYGREYNYRYLHNDWDRRNPESGERH